MKTAKVKRKYNKFTAMTLVHIYRFARAGMRDAAIAAAIGVKKCQFSTWRITKPIINEALELARNQKSNALADWHRYLHERLPKEVAELWDRIEGWNQKPGGVAKVEELFRDKGTKIRQQLFLHALLLCNFSVTKACAKVNLDWQTLQKWVRDEPEFTELMEGIQEFKGNFFEDSLIDLVAKGDQGAVLFANRTFNKKRGYGGSLDINHQVSGSLEHHLLDLNELDLPFEVRVQVLNAIKKRDEQREQERRIANMPLECRVVDNMALQIAEVGNTS